MKRSIYAVVALTTLVCSLTTFAQPDTVWTRTYDFGGWGSNAFRTDDDGLLLLVGGGYSEGEVDTMFLWKVSAVGDSLWSVPIVSGNYVGRYNASTMLANGNILVVTDSAYSALDESASRCFVVDQAGTILVDREISDSLGYLTAASTPDGGALLSAVDPSGSDVDMVILKLSSQADIEWMRVYGDSVFGERCWNLSVDTEGRFLATTTTQGYDGELYRLDNYETLYDQSGDTLWSQRLTHDPLGHSWWSGSTPVDNGFVVYGYFYGIVGDSLFVAAWVIKYGLNGDSLWSRLIPNVNTLYGAPFADNAIATSDNGVIVVGHEPHDSYWTKLDASGDIIWYQASDVDTLITNSRQRILRMADDGYVLVKSLEIDDERFVELTRTTPDIVAVPPVHELPSSIVLHPNYPNPFNPTTEISFDLPRAMQTNLKIFDVLGREVAVLTDGVLNAGAHSVVFDANALSSGVYFYRLEAGSFVETRKMVLMK